MTMRGTPYIYQGDELGMTNYQFKSMDEFNDIEALNGYKDEVQGRHIVTEAAYIENLRHMSRDNARTPMQWDNSPNGGFTTGAKPWLAVNPNYKDINAAQEQGDPNSIYSYYARMAKFREKTPALIYGDFKDLDPQNAAIFAYTRILGEEKYLIVLNFSNREIDYTLPTGLKAGQLQLSNLGTREEKTSVLKLKGWEARVYKQ